MNADKINKVIIKGISRVVTLDTFARNATSERNKSQSFSKLGDFFYNETGNIEIFKESNLSKKGILVNKDA